MGAWDTEVACYNAIRACYSRLQTATERAANHLADANVHFLGIPAGDTKECIRDILFCLADIRDGLLYLADEDTGYNPPHPLPYYLDNYNMKIGDAPDGITWEDIVEAWVAAPLDGVKFTISILDYMREAIWDEPYNAIFYKPATEFWI